MPNITPPPAATTTPPVASASPSGGITPVEASIGNAPDKIQQLARQVQVSGLITRPPDGGEITLNTVIGNLTIILPQLASVQQQKLLQQLVALFQSQKPLTVVVQPGNPPAQAFLLLPPAPNAPGAPPPGIVETNVLFQTVNPSQSPPQPLAPGTALPAVVLPVNTMVQSGSAQPPAAPPLPEEMLLAFAPEMASLEELAARTEALAATIIPKIEEQILAAFSLPRAGQASAAAQSAAPVPLPQIFGAPATQLFSQASPAAPAGNVAPPLLALIRPGTELTLRVDAVGLPSAAPLVANLPNQVLATVTGSGPNGQLLLNAGNATLYVKQGVADAPVGTTLLVTVTPSRDAVSVPLPNAGNFGVLQQALAALAQVDPQLARQVMENVIPQPNTALPGALLFLLSAFRQGDARNWLGGNATDTLAKIGKMELISRLSQQLSEGGQTVHDPVVGAWRSYPLPLYDNSQFQVLHLYVHNERRGQGGEKEPEGKPAANAVRFLIDMRLSKLGAMQLDGFVRARQLDMIIRSEQALPEGLNEDLRQSYASTLSAIGYGGSLNFQAGRRHWLVIGKSAGAGSVVT